MKASVTSLGPTGSEPSGHTVASSLVQAVNCLRDRTTTPRLEAELLLAHVLRCSRAHLYAHPEYPVTSQQHVDYQELLNRRAEGEPLPYLTGHAEFYGLDFAVDPRVLIPRPETETLVELALELISHHSSPLIADVGTGSGCIGVTLAVHAPAARVYGLDLSPQALHVAQANALRHGVAERMTFLQSDLLRALPEPVDLIVANPPYVAYQDWPSLPPEVRVHEPHLALDGGRDGLDLIRRLLDHAPTNLRPGGATLLEIGATQGPAAARLARRVFATADVTVQADLGGRDRVLYVQMARLPDPALNSPAQESYG
jgi:release factor glutamine methyltransferase